MPGEILEHCWQLGKASKVDVDVGPEDSSNVHDKV